MGSYLVRLEITTTVLIAVDGCKRKEASAKAKALLASDKYKDIEINWVNNPGGEIPVHLVGRPQCTEIIEQQLKEVE
jgi:hypothetical protein